MIAAILEVYVKEEHRQEYLDIAAQLRPLLDDIDGFISVERFESLYTPGKLISLSFWRDEEAIAAWQQVREHHIAQAKGRATIFEDYRMKIAGVIWDYGKRDRAQAPQNRQASHQ
ncbi:antibiotic biosynthesis monooxygenase family protein [Ktedonospora formicarum]|uniref:Antibiotic biosynthesis monooxygenase n=1 Tax=Ktedonospora formicarum TaxID=2778364 RepID=A0A8J3IC33_9CHLR|nr:antibiotic biosynthesis monooxygenase [Ktedonospora formicarum]GHO51256.1 antibiotic biosynthesis monooxygenase [Ktedonospora formicarum]